VIAPINKDHRYISYRYNRTRVLVYRERKNMFPSKRSRVERQQTLWIRIFAFACLLFQAADSTDAATTTTSSSSSRRNNSVLRRMRAHGGGGSLPDIVPCISYIGEPPKDPVTLTYGACQGRCTQHRHCQDGLFCIQRTPDDSIISTCLPTTITKNDTITNTLRLLNYCAEVPDNELVTLVMGNTTTTADGNVTSTTAMSLPPCHGGCMAHKHPYRDVWGTSTH
jgi:hypothetical protein